MKMQKRVFVIVVVAIVLALAGLACGESEPQTVEVTREVEVPQTVEVTRVVEKEVEVTRVVEVEVERIVEKEVEVTRVVEVESEVVVTATPIPQETPIVFLDIEGYGEQVTENFAFPRCNKAVFSWTADRYGFLIVHLYNVDADGGIYLINGSGGSGEVLQSLKGGTYYLATENADRENWTIRGDCLD